MSNYITHYINYAKITYYIRDQNKTVNEILY